MMIRQRDTYIYCTSCKTKLLQEDGYKQCPKCDKQYFFNARPTISLLLTNSKNEVLLTKRAREPFKDWWDLPGGFVEEGETLEQAVERELKEETNLTVTDLKYLGSIPEDYHFHGEIITVVAAVFSGVTGDSQKVIVADDVSDYKFVPIDELDIDKIAFDNQREFLRKILK